MALTYQPPFPQTITTASAVTQAQTNTISDAPTNTSVLQTWNGTGLQTLTVSGNGALLMAISAAARDLLGSPTFYLFESMDGGTTKRLINAITLTSNTVAGQTITPFKRNSQPISAANPAFVQAATTFYVGCSVTSQAVGTVWHAELQQL